MSTNENGVDVTFGEGQANPRPSNSKIIMDTEPVNFGNGGYEMAQDANDDTYDNYIKELRRIEEEERDRTHILVFGVQGSGKTHVIAGIINFMHNCQKGTVYLDKELSTDIEQNIYNEMRAIYDKQSRQTLGRTPVNEFKKLRVNFNKDGVIHKFTFLDVSGEHCNRALRMIGVRQYDGQLPFHIRATLHADVNCLFLLVYDSQNVELNNDQNIGQANVLSAFYEILLREQNERNRQGDKKYKEFKKLLLVTKWDQANWSRDKDEQEELIRYTSNRCNIFYNNFNAENNLNSIAAFSLGNFDNNLLARPNDLYAEKVFKWIFENATGKPLCKKPSKFKLFLERLMNWLKNGRTSE